MAKVSTYPAVSASATGDVLYVIQDGVSKKATIDQVLAFIQANISETIDDRVAALLIQGANVTLTYNDGAGSLTVAVADEAIDDRVAALLQAGTGVTLTYNDALNTLTISASGLAGSTNLDDLADVSTAGVVDGYVLTYDTGVSPPMWVAQPAPGAGTLDDLTDVTTSGAADRDSLIYDANSPTGWRPGKPTESFVIAVGDETTAIAAGTSKVTWRMPYAFTVAAVRGGLSTAQTSGGQVSVDVNEAGVSILSTKLLFDNGSKTTVGSSPQPVISDSSIADDAEMSIDIDNVGDGTAKGLKVTLIGHRT